ncbi:MAG: FimB/Mfa2 family fimbrial subunit [Alistipes sp.]|nr:FimB/Mfa2 family fimbrial subunit [Alistipes sp.]
MKLNRIILLIGLLGALHGCYEEDFSICDEANVELGFSLMDDDGRDIFLENISAVNVFLFDEYGYYVTQSRVENSELSIFQGVRMVLEPGSYNVVCWGNVNGNTNMSQEESADLYITYKGIDADGITTIDADRVFYGPVVAGESSLSAETYNSFELEVTESGAAEVIYFGYAHRTLDIRIKGFTDHDGERSLPELRVSGLPMGLGYGREVMKDADGNTLTVMCHKATEWVTESGETYAYTAVNALYFDMDEEIELDVIDPVTGGSVYNASLTYILELLELKDETLILIPLILEFVDGDVSISFPGWSTENPGTGFGR